MLKIFRIYITVFVIFTALYILFFQIGLFSFQKVLFYKGILLLTLTTAIYLLGIVWFTKSHKQYLESLLAALVLSFSLNLSFFVLLPVTVERSVTTFILSSIEQGNSSSCKGLSTAQIETNLINDYIIGNHAVDKRIEEQTIINTIVDNNKCIQLTKRGSNFLRFADVVRKIYKF